MVEHVAQVIQKFYLKRNIAHGIVGQLDLEWVHFGYNLMILAAIHYLFIVFTPYLRDRGRVSKTFLALVIIQSYHMLEHVTKIIQHLNTGKQGTPGILGNFINPIWFHFWINLGVWAFAGVSLVQLGVHRHLWNMVVKPVRDDA
jgi:hypothetical protein